MKKLNDFELIYLIKRGNADALELMFKKYKNYVYLKLRNLSISKDEKEEILQECLMLLSKAIYRFDENYNVLFVTYVDKIFTRLINKYSIDYYKKKDAIEYLIILNENKLKENGIRYNTYDKLSFDDRLNYFLKRLTKNEENVYYEIMILRLSIDSFAKKYDLNNKAVYNYIQSVRKKYTKYMNVNDNIID